MDTKDVKYITFDKVPLTRFSSDSFSSMSNYEVNELPKITHVLVKASGITGYAEMKFTIGKAKEYGICIGSEVTIEGNSFIITKLEGIYGDKE